MKKSGVPPQLISQYLSVAGNRNTPHHHFYLKTGGYIFKNIAAFRLNGSRSNMGIYGALRGGNRPIKDDEDFLSQAFQVQRLGPNVSGEIWNLRRAD